MGIDLHGQDVQTAAERAVTDATSKSCLCGLTEILNIDDFGKKVHLTVTVAVTRPEDVDAAKIAKRLPIGEVEVIAVKGGLKASGVTALQFGDKDDSIEVAIACVEVGIVD
jgi:uncharacterized protein (TIGR02058 family)